MGFIILLVGIIIGIWLIVNSFPKTADTWKAILFIILLFVGATLVLVLLMFGLIFLIHSDTLLLVPLILGLVFWLHSLKG